MTEERRVDMVRLVGEERLYDKEALLGRDTSSVFPSLARQQEQDESGAGSGAILEALGARKFISETELESLRATRGVTADDGGVAVDKPLAEILRERKAAKDAEHEEKWKLMKIGKNRPLDPEELQFLDSVAAAEAERERAWSEMERAELEAFKAAVRERFAEPEAEAGPGPAQGPAQGPAATAALSTKADPRVPSVVAAGAAVAAAPKPLLKPLVKVKPKAAAAAAKDAREGAPAGPTPGPSKHTATATRATAAAGAGASEPPAKKAKTGAGAGDIGDDENDGSGGSAGGAGGEGSAAVTGAGLTGGGALAALVGGYGSDSDPDSDPDGR